LAIIASVVSTASAQPSPRVRILQAPEARGFAFSNDDEPRAVIGVTTSASSSMRDTLGILVSSVTAGGPAERAGVEEGSRIASINGVSLRVSPNDAEDSEMSGIMQRRLTRELRKVKPGDEVELRVYSGGSNRTVHVRTASSDELYKPLTRRTLQERPTLGFSVGSSGSRRDSLGVLVMYVNDSGPAARAGIEEGNRIAAINGIELRVNSADAGDGFIANAKMRRLQREIADLKPGDDVDLRVYQNGSFRTLRLRAVKASELSSRGNVFIFGDGAASTMTLPPIPMPPDDVDGTLIGADIRRAIERAMEATGRNLEGVGRTLDGVGRSLNRARIEWNDDDDDRASTPRPSGVVTPAPSRRTYRTATTPSVGTAVTTTIAASGEESALVAAPAVATAGGRAGNYAFSATPTSLTFAGLKVSLVDRELASYLGEGSEGGLLVMNVPDWADGLRKGDVILSVNDNPVKVGDSARMEFGDTRSATFEILRKGDRSKVTVDLPH